MFKKILKGLVVGGAALTIAASAAQAAQIDINLYGASAQFKFWTEAAPGFIKYAGCADADNYAAVDDSNHDRDTGMAVCAGDVAISAASGSLTGSGIDGDTVVMRYTSRASVDGILAVQGLDDVDGCGTDGLREQGSTTGADLVAYPGVGSSIPTLACLPVTIGASDVAAATFNQSSSGEEFGHDDSGDVISPSYIAGDNVPVPSGFREDRPVVVPFGFFANDDATTPVPFDNLSRLQAVSLFSGQVTNWNEFDPSLASLPVVLCLRHAGSGTHSTIDAAVMRADAPLMTQEYRPGHILVTIGTYPVTYFNLGSSDEMRCVGNNVGAVGYADVDKWTPGVTKYGDVKALTFQGVAGNRKSIKNGQYDFWSAQWLYSNPAEGSTLEGLIIDLADFAADPANLPSKKVDYWAAQSEMVWKKSTDFQYPAQ